MVLAHLADLHLGYRAYHRLAPGGINARERDISRAFDLAIDRLIGLGVDLIVIAGDIFHTVRPSNWAISGAFRQFSRLRSALPSTPIVVIAGNHDSPRIAETGSILRLLGEIPGVIVVDDVARPIHLEELETTVLCLPHNALARGEGVTLEPDPRATTNILTLHGTVRGGPASRLLRYESEYGGAEVEYSAIDPARWDYVALGHYHIATEFAPNIWYAGGLDRTSTNIWEEASSAKGFVTYDTESRRSTFHPIPGREVVDLPAFSAEGLGPGEIDERIQLLVEGVPGGIGEKIVRLVITDLPRRLYRDLDHRQIREYKAEALHFHLDPREPEVEKTLGYGAAERRLTLEEEVRHFLTDHWERRSPDLEVSKLIELAEHYLEGTDRSEAEG